MSEFGRRRFLIATNALILAPFPVVAKEDAKIHRIGFLWGGRPSPGLKVFVGELRKRGWIEGENFSFVHRIAEGRYDRLPELAAELVSEEVNVILTQQLPSTIAAKKATQSIPIVMWGNGDPVAYGLVTNLARPEANVTGVTFLVHEICVKLLELLKEINPRLEHVAGFLVTTNPGSVPYLRAMHTAAQRLGVKSTHFEVSTPNDLDAAFESIRKAKVDTLQLGPEALMFSQRVRIMEFANRHGLVVGGNAEVFAKAGAIVSYSPRWAEIPRRAAYFVDKILRGAKPADLPVEQPRQVEVVVNLKAAKALGLTIPPSVLIRADRVIE
ncbi:MAG: ABC transporter substrate-binding protein [Burkholderiaceae bacterium]